MYHIVIMKTLAEWERKGRGEGGERRRKVKGSKEGGKIRREGKKEGKEERN